MTGKIEVDVQKANAAANAISSVAALLREIISSSTGLLGSLSEVWAGDSAGAFSARMEEWTQENRSICQSLEAIAAELKRAAQAFAETDSSLAGETFGGYASGGSGGGGGGRW